MHVDDVRRVGIHPAGDVEYGELGDGKFRVIEVPTRDGVMEKDPLQAEIAELREVVNEVHVVVMDEHIRQRERGQVGERLDTIPHCIMQHRRRVRAAVIMRHRPGHVLVPFSLADRPVAVDDPSGDTGRYRASSKDERAHEGNHVFILVPEFEVLVDMLRVGPDEVAVQCPSGQFLKLPGSDADAVEIA